MSVPTSYQSTATIPQLADRIRRAQRVMLCTHTKPDGDALGSCLALSRALDTLGKQSDIFLMGPIDSSLLALAHTTPMHYVEDQPPGEDYDLIVILDTGAWKQLEPLGDYLKNHRDIIIGVDHHTNGDDIAPQRIVDARCASTTQVLANLLDELDVPLVGGEGGISDALFVGLATDTGWFRFDNADAEAFAFATRLLRTGVDKSRLYQQVEETQRPQRLQLAARALQSIGFVDDESVAVMSLSQRDFEETGGMPQDITGLINEPMFVRQVRVSILLTQREEDLTKVSFRSKPPGPGQAPDEFTDVNRLAEKFGGGGHVHAAGCVLNMNLDDARRAIIEAVETPAEPQPSKVAP